MARIRRPATAITTLIVLVIALERPLGVFDTLSNISGMVKAMSDWLTEFDKWLIEQELHPWLLALAAVILLSGWIIPDLWPWVRRSLVSSRARQFEKSFGDPRNDEARHQFRTLAHEGYTRSVSSLTYEHGAQGQRLRSVAELKRRLDSIDVPIELPLSDGSLYAWTTKEHPKWVGDSLLDVWSFCLHMYPHLGIPQAEGPPLLGNSQSTFDEARNRTAKFWDHWGREISGGRLKWSDIAHPLKSHERDLKLLAYLELAVMLQTGGWDEGIGKSGLFFVAKGPREGQEQRWWKRWWGKSRGAWKRQKKKIEHDR